MCYRMERNIVFKVLRERLIFEERYEVITMNENIENTYECSIEHFIDSENGNYSICREERQYAVFLYNILRKYRSPEAEERKGNTSVREIFDACRIPNEAEIEKVFFEATFMRDFFERDRRIAEQKRRVEAGNRHNNLEQILCQKKCKISVDDSKDSKESFNQKLIHYVKKAPVAYIDKALNLGQNEIVCDELSGDDKKTIQSMMNAKPDIAVIYNDNSAMKKLLFLECKFESGESSDRNGVKQSQIQWEIADFLCNHYLEKECIEISERMKDQKSCIIKFVRKKTDKSENEIQIDELIKLDANIFS